MMKFPMIEIIFNTMANRVHFELVVIKLIINPIFNNLSLPSSSTVPILNRMSFGKKAHALYECSEKKNNSKFQNAFGNYFIDLQAKSCKSRILNVNPH